MEGGAAVYCCFDIRQSRRRGKQAVYCRLCNVLTAGGGGHPISRLNSLLLLYNLLNTFHLT